VSNRRGYRYRRPRGGGALGRIPNSLIKWAVGVVLAVIAGLIGIEGGVPGASEARVRETVKARTPVDCHAPRIADGDTLRCDGLSVRLSGIDAPELAETRCANPGGDQAWACQPYARAYAQAAADRLTQLTRGAVHCQPTGEQSHQRVVARCEAGAGDLGAAIVADGLAISETKFGDPYRREEDQARRQGLGVWASGSK
jgi:endonuclease YncB( thermonuclease family)